MQRFAMSASTNPLDYASLPWSVPSATDPMPLCIYEAATPEPASEKNISVASLTANYTQSQINLHADNIQSN